MTIYNQSEIIKDLFIDYRFFILSQKYPPNEFQFVCHVEEYYQPLEMYIQILLIQLFKSLYPNISYF